MSDEDRAWYTEPRHGQDGYTRQRTGGGSQLPLQIAVGVALGIIVAAAVIWGGKLLMLRLAAEAVSRSLREQAAAVEAQRNRDEEAAARARQAAIVQAAARQRTAEVQKRAVVDEKDRKEQAWARFYQKPARCDEATGGAWTMECANQFIRTKRDFEEKYAAGRL